MPEDQGDKPGNPTQNQKEDNGTECQKTREASPGNPTQNRKEAGNDDGTECQKIGETSAGTRRNQEMTMEPEESGNDDGTENQKSRETSPRKQEMMMEQNAKRVGRQAPEPYPEPEGSRK